MYVVNNMDEGELKREIAEGIIEFGDPNDLSVNNVALGRIEPVATRRAFPIHRNPGLDSFKCSESTNLLTRAIIAFERDGNRDELDKLIIETRDCLGCSLETVSSQIGDTQKHILKQLIAVYDGDFLKDFGITPCET